MNKQFRGAAALACGLAASGAQAQSAVHIYGIVDTGVVHITHTNAAGDSVTKMPSITGEFPSRIGFRGTENLGDGLQAFFVLENGFAVDAGGLQQGNRLFGRAANVGLKGAWGSVTLGRQQNMTFISMLKASVLGPNVFAAGSFDAYLPNARSDNAIGYSGTFNDVVVGATWSLGRDVSSAGGPAATNCAGEVPGNARACRQYTGMIGYETKPWGVNIAYDRMYGNTGAAGGLASSANSDSRSLINAYLMLGTTKIGAGVLNRKSNAVTGSRKSMLYYFGASHPFGPLSVDVEWSSLNVKHSIDDAAMLVARATYALSRRTYMYTSIGHIRNDGSSAVALDAGGSAGAGMAQSGIMVGARHHF